MRTSIAPGVFFLGASLACYGHAPMIDFTLTDEQQTIVETVRDFVRRELSPHDDEVERLGHVPQELAAEIRRKALEAGLYAMNMPEELGGGGLDYVTRALCTEQFSRAGTGLSSIVHQPTLILLACEGEQRERYLLPTIRASGSSASRSPSRAPAPTRARSRRGRCATATTGS